MYVDAEAMSPIGLTRLLCITALLITSYSYADQHRIPVEIRPIQ